MAEANPDSTEQEEVTPDVIFEALPYKVQKEIKALRFKKDPLNILVIGPAGSGKSRLVNILLGRAVVRQGRGARSVTTEMKGYDGEFMGVKIRVYDTVGFSDTEGRSDEDTMSEIARDNKFSLILMCVRMDSRVDANAQKNFTILSQVMHPDEWARAVVVLTFADAFLLQENVPPLTPDQEKEEIRQEIAAFRVLISRAVNNPAFYNVPFCVAGKRMDRRLPTTDDWLADLWTICLKHFSEESLPLFQAYTAYQAALHQEALQRAGLLGGGIGGAGGAVGLGAIGVGIGAGGGAAVGGIIGAIFGSVLPGAGTLAGAALGATIGAYAGGSLVGVISSAAGGMAGGAAGAYIAQEVTQHEITRRENRRQRW